MSIRTITASEVGCQRCDATIVVSQWRQAAKHGWAVPVDGHLQLCPACLKRLKAAIGITDAGDDHPIDVLRLRDLADLAETIRDLCVWVAVNEKTSLHDTQMMWDANADNMRAISDRLSPPVGSEDKDP